MIDFLFAVLNECVFNEHRSTFLIRILFSKQLNLEAFETFSLFAVNPLKIQKSFKGSNFRISKSFKSSRKFN